MRDNQIFGIQGTPTPTLPNEAGIWIDDTGTVANVFSPVIDNNIIVDNEDYGIILLGPEIENLAITNNRIGADGTGFPGPNATGILIQGAELQGAVIAGNEIVFNGDGVVVLFTDGIQFSDNLIAYNAGNGIELSSGANEHFVTDNYFIENGNAGIAIGTGTSDSSFLNRVEANYFQGNGGLPIDLARNGVVEANDSGDLDSGPNALQNYPEILEASIVDEDTHWRVPVQLDVRANGEYRLEFYRFDPSPSLQSYTFIRAETRELTTSSGFDLQEDFLFEKSTELASGQHIAVLVIRDNGDTSELVKTVDPLLDLAPPRLTNIVLKGTGFEYSFDDISAAGHQLDPLTVAGIDTVEIHFSENVNLNGDPLTIIGSTGNSVAATLQPVIVGNIRTWTLAAALTADKYSIVLESDLITDDAAKTLDGEWDMPISTTDFVTQPDNKGRLAQEFPTGSDNSEGGDFQFHFAVLPTGSANILRATRRSGDYDDNEIVDQNDYAVWKMTFGTTSPQPSGYWADGNDNGIVDAADYTTWRDRLGQFSAWSEAVGSGGGSSAFAIPLVLFGEAPRVTNVTISGSNSTHAPYSFATATYDGQPVVGSGNQLRTVPVGGADTVSITFSEDVNVVASYLQLVGMRTANRPTLAEFHYDLGTMTATWRFENWAVADHYVISLSDAVTDVEGNLLDGEWTNPRTRAVTSVFVSEFPSGDGTAGGDFNFVATLLPGDATLNSHVNTADGSIVDFGYTMGLTGATFAEGDFTGDGLVTSADVALYEATFGINLKELTLLADLNGDWVVDDLDRDILFENWDSELPNPTPADGDLDDDGAIDIDDLDLMFAQYGLALLVVG